MLTRKEVQIPHLRRANVSPVKSVPKTGVNVAGCFYEEKNRDFNGYNGAGRKSYGSNKKSQKENEKTI